MAKQKELVEGLRAKKTTKEEGHSHYERHSRITVFITAKGKW